VDKAKTKVLVSILKDSSLYQTRPRGEKNSLLQGWKRINLPYALFIAQEYEFEGEKESSLANSGKMYKGDFNADIVGIFGE
jgi:hypothetical protein